MSLDWDKLRIFLAAGEAGSFTHAGDKLGLSQSAVSRQVLALERELKVPLFHRHARGLILTEQGDLLFRTTREVFAKLEATRATLADTREVPGGELRITTTVGLGASWLAPRLGEFLELYPEITLQVILSDDELDLAMREADVAIRLRQPVQPELIHRRLFTVHFHIFASPDYLARHGTPRTIADLDNHRIVKFGGPIPSFLSEINWLCGAGRDHRNPRKPVLTINHLVSLRRALEQGTGLGILPDYLVEQGSSLVQVMMEREMPNLDAYLVYPEEMRNVARVSVFRDFLVSKAQRWSY
jgi:DNA-binding transcriptional LysR family regulator